MNLHRRLVVALGVWSAFGALFAAGAYFGATLRSRATLNFASVWLLTAALMLLGAWLARRDERLGRGLRLAGAVVSACVCLCYLFR